MGSLQDLLEHVAILRRHHRRHPGIERSHRMPERSCGAIELLGNDLLFHPAGANEDDIEIVAVLAQPVELLANSRHIRKRQAMSNDQARQNEAGKKAKPAGQWRGDGMRRGPGEPVKRLATE